MGRKRKDPAPQSLLEAAEAPVVFAAEDETQEAAAEVAALPEETPEAAPTSWLVLEDKVVSLFGQMTNLPAGTVVSARSYGPAGVRRIMEQGVVLAPLA